MLHCRIAKCLEAHRRIFRCLWMWSIARFERKVYWSFARWWKNLFRDFVPLKKWIWKSLLANSRPRSVYKNNVFGPPLFRIFAKALRIDSPVLFFSGSCKVWKLFNNNQHERVTVIEHFHICQVNQISLSLIINAADNSATTLEITTKKLMQRVPGCTVRWWRLHITLSIPRPLTLRSVCFLKSRECVTAE